MDEAIDSLTEFPQKNENTIRGRLGNQVKINRIMLDKPVLSCTSRDIYMHIKHKNSQNPWCL
jgi:hypothetical protein